MLAVDAGHGDAGRAYHADRIFFADGQPVPREQLMSERVLHGETALAEEFTVLPCTPAALPRP